MEVAAGGPGGGTVTEARSRARLNVALLATAVVCSLLVGLAAYWWQPWQDVDALGGDAGDISGRAGTSVGRGTVTAVSAADEAEQERVAAQIEGATKLVTAFLNLRHDETEANFATIREWATGQFLQEWEAGEAALAEQMELAKSVSEADVVWAGLVAGDEESARVIVAVDGTVSNESTGLEPENRYYRIQVDLILDEGRWRTRDLQYVRAQLGSSS